MKNEYGIWRTEKRARFFRTSAGFMFDHTTEKPMRFDSESAAVAFLRSELAESVGEDYEVRIIK